MVEQILAAIRRGRELLKNPKEARSSISRGAFVKEATIGNFYAKVSLRSHPFASDVEVWKHSAQPSTIVVHSKLDLSIPMPAIAKFSAVLSRQGYEIRNVKGSWVFTNGGGKVGEIRGLNDKAVVLSFSEEHAEPLLRALVEEAKVLPGIGLRLLRGAK